jgi:carboxyl-terminal processing protease
LYTEGLHTKRTEYKSTGKTFFPVGKVAVIINENSVSASEVLAGSLQDLDRAIIVGRRSFGKGLVQEMYDLTPESAINLTVAKYYLPSGRSIQKSYTDRDHYEKEIDSRIKNGELFTRDSMIIHDQDQVNGIVGNGRPSGEGILPDIFVPADTFYLSPDWKKEEHHIYRDAFTFYIKNQKSIAESLEQGDSLRSLLPSIEERPFFSEAAPDTSIRSKLMEGYIHLLKWHHFGEKEYYIRMLEEDNEVQTALKALH